MQRDEIVDRLQSLLSVQADVLAVLFTGSMGRGDSDEMSDIDLVVVVMPDAVAGFADRWPGLRQHVSSLVFAQRVDVRPTVLFNQITTDWVRYDLLVTTADALGPRSRSIVRPMFDRSGIYDRLPAHRPLQGPSAQVVGRIVPEFFRVLSLISVALGRDDYAVGASGSTLLRTMLIQVFTEQVESEDRGGALHLKRLLPPDRYDIIAGIPPIEATRDSVVAVHRYCAEHFAPVARELCATTGVAWPDALVRGAAEVTRAHLGDWLDAARDDGGGAAPE